MTITVAEQIAAVVADIRAGRVQHHCDDPVISRTLLDRARAPQPVVDVTAIHRGLTTRDSINMYEDFPSCVSPWDDALIAYVNNYSNVMVMQVRQLPWDEGMRWDTNNPVDWDRVRWMIESSVWVGGRSGDGRALPATGPVHLIQHAVYEDGQPADIHWIALLGDHDETTWQMPIVVLNATLNFLGCSNIEVAEPSRPFPVRQRLRKARVQVQTIVVRPPGRRSRGGAARPVDALDTPLTSVRGHFARYGPEHGRGLLFGKHSGRFWIAAHARGAGEGEAKDYVLRPGAAS